MSKFRVWIAFVLIPLAVLAFGGCAGEPAPVVTVTATATPAPTVVPGEQALIDAYESEFGPLSPADQNGLIDLVYSICDAVDRGASWDEVFEIGSASSIDPYELGYIVGAGVTALCPVHLDSLDNWINSVNYAT